MEDIFQSKYYNQNLAISSLIEYHLGTMPQSWLTILQAYSILLKKILGISSMIDIYNRKIYYIDMVDKSINIPSPPRRGTNPNPASWILDGTNISWRRRPWSSSLLLRFLLERTGKKLIILNIRVKKRTYCHGFAMLVFLEYWKIK